MTVVCVWCCGLLAAVLVPPASAVPEADVVQNLPGWDRELFSRTYSGYIDAGAEEGYTMHEHYLFFESEGNPKRDPLIMWTNGGPGASSLFGSFSELGPYYLSDMSLKTDQYRSTGVPSLFENKYRWTKFGNLLIRNLPPPVGFSYCDPAGPAGDGHSCGSWNDTRTARHSVQFMKNWFKAFPEFGSHDLFLLGESYAGIYVPMLAREIVKSELAPLLKGFAVGDGCLGSDNSSVCLPAPWGSPYFSVQFYYGHGQISTKTYWAIMGACSNDELFAKIEQRSPACDEALQNGVQERGYNFQYNLYDECYDFNLNSASAGHTPSGSSISTGSLGYEDHHMDGAPCGGTAVLPKWVNSSEVKRALHVPPDAVFFDSDGGGEAFTYNSTEPSLLPLYQDLVKNTKLRILVYNGDTDPGLNSFIGENWTAAVGVPVREAWRPWTQDGKLRMGGFVTRYAHDFDFLTIRGSGHMVPEYKPRATAVFVEAWLANADYPRYHKPQNVELPSGPLRPRERRQPDMRSQVLSHVGQPSVVI